MKSQVFIRHILISAGHNYFGHHGGPPSRHEIMEVPQVCCRAGLGLEGDRFYGYRPNYNGQVTFFAWETYEGIRREFNLPALEVGAFRRNVIVEGANLNDLIGSRFTLGGIEFEGMGESKPCDWMNVAVAPGAEKWLRGQGGLRAKILTDGTLRQGSTALFAQGLLAL